MSAEITEDALLFSRFRFRHDVLRNQRLFTFGITALIDTFLLDTTFQCQHLQLLTDIAQEQEFGVLFGIRVEEDNEATERLVTSVGIFYGESTDSLFDILEGRGVAI